MRRNLISVVGAAAIALAGCAGGAGVKPATVAQSHPLCPQETGSRIPRPQGQCMAPGNVYTSEDIDRTGATTAAGALRLLDPALTVTGR